MDDYKLLTKIVAHNAWYRHESNARQDQSHWLNSQPTVLAGLRQKVLITGAEFISVHPVAFKIDQYEVRLIPIWNGRSGDFDVQGFLDKEDMEWHSVVLNSPGPEEFKRLWNTTILLINPTKGGSQSALTQSLGKLDKLVETFEKQKNPKTEAFCRKYRSFRKETAKLTA